MGSMFLPHGVVAEGCPISLAEFSPASFEHRARIRHLGSAQSCLSLSSSKKVTWLSLRLCMSQICLTRVVKIKIRFKKVDVKVLCKTPLQRCFLAFVPSFTNHIYSSALLDPPTEWFLGKAGFYHPHFHIRKLRSWEVLGLAQSA